MGKYSPKEKVRVGKQLLTIEEKPEDWETVYFCNKCEACDLFCSQEIKLSELIDESRRIIVERWGIQYPRQKILINLSLVFP